MLDYRLKKKVCTSKHWVFLWKKKRPLLLEDWVVRLEKGLYLQSARSPKQGKIKTQCGLEVCRSMTENAHFMLQ